MLQNTTKGCLCIKLLNMMSHSIVTMCGNNNINNEMCFSTTLDTNIEDLQTSESTMPAAQLIHHFQ